MFNFLKPTEPSIACTKCGGAISVGSNNCNYCGTKYDRDLLVIKYGLESPKTGRNCPNCESELQSIDLDIGHRFIVERCQDCYGVYLEKLELEELLKRIYSYPGEPSIARLYELLKCPDREREKIKYKDCPECGRMMDRKNFGFRSGVVMDVCFVHGTWLDGGELYHILKWSAAGGQNSKCPTEERNKKLHLEFSNRKLQEKKEKEKEIRRRHYRNNWLNWR